MCGKNGFACNELEFAAGCNRFGLDNPTPIITRRLAHYGNEENVEKLLERLYRNYNDPNFFDPEKFGSIYPDKTMPRPLDNTMPTKVEKIKNVRDMGETLKMRRPGKKVSAVHNINMLDKLDNTKKFESPANVVLARNITVKIKDIPKNTTLRGKTQEQERMTNNEMGVTDEKQIVVPSFGTVGALFARHFDILRNLKRRIMLLKQSHEN